MDFLAIECLRVFTPTVYTFVRDNKNLFVMNESNYDFRNTKPEDRRQRHETSLANVPADDQEPARAILRRSFPLVASAYGGLNYGHEWESGWRKRLMIRSNDVFDTYFRLSVPTGALSKAEIDAILALGGDAEAFGSALLGLSKEPGLVGSTKVKAFLERLEDYTKDGVPDDHIESVLQALYDVADELICRKTKLASVRFLMT